MHKAITLLLLPAVLATANVDSNEEAIKKELAKLKGTWNLIAIEANGQALEYTADPVHDWVFDGTKLVDPATGKAWMTFTIDPTTTPKIMDLTSERSKRTLEAIYDLDGDSLKICMNREVGGVKERPSEFTTKDRPKWNMVVYKRARSKAEPGK